MAIMNVYSNTPIWPNRNIFGIMLATLFLSSFSVSEVSISFSDEIIGKSKLVITGSEFYRRSQYDAGEIRVFFKNAGKESISICQPKLSRLVNSKDNESYKAGTEVEYLYSKFTPPVLNPGRNGELLIKLLRSPPYNCKFQCAIYSETDWVSETIIAIKQAPVWISYVGFSEDLSEIYVFGQNNTKTTLTFRLIEVAGVYVGDNYQTINNNIPPGDKGCLVFKMSNRITLGEYVHLVISAESNEQGFQTSRIVKAVNKFPLSSGGGFFSPKLGLDSENCFVQTMSCPAHDHGTHKGGFVAPIDHEHGIHLVHFHTLLLLILSCRKLKHINLTQKTVIHFARFFGLPLMQRRRWHQIDSLPVSLLIPRIMSSLKAVTRLTRSSSWFIVPSPPVPKGYYIGIHRPLAG